MISYTIKKQLVSSVQAYDDNNDKDFLESYLCMQAGLTLYQSTYIHKYIAEGVHRSYQQI